jgi:hypothetical protein
MLFKKWIDEVKSACGTHEVQHAQLSVRCGDSDANIWILLMKFRKTLRQIIHGAFGWHRDRELPFDQLAPDPRRPGWPIPPPVAGLPSRVQAA